MTLPRFDPNIGKNSCDPRSIVAGPPLRPGIAFWPVIR
jgi:hypothetical protein